MPALLAVFAYRLINLWLPMIPALAGLPTPAPPPGSRAQPRRAIVEGVAVDSWLWVILVVALVLFPGRSGIPATKG